MKGRSDSNSNPHASKSDNKKYNHFKLSISLSISLLSKTDKFSRDNCTKYYPKIYFIL